jgi:hypothetical protein
MKPDLFFRIVEFIMNDRQTKEQSRFEPRFYTRNRKLPFADVLCLLLDMQKTSLQARLNHFFARTGQEVTMTEQALSKARSQFSHLPFERMLRGVVEDEYSGRHTMPLWNGYHLLAVDGSTAQLPDTKELREHFGVLGGGGGHACAGMSVLYDLLNGWVLDPVFTGSGMDERAELKKHIAYLKEHLPNVAEKALMILDRGYPSTDVLKELERAGIKYLCRCSKSFFTEVNDAPAGDSVVVHGKSGLKLRVYKFMLPTGEEEILVTNLFDEDCSVFPELYAKRWGIETAYGILKNRLCVENFSGRSVNTVLQDLWASMVLMNAVSVLRDEADILVQEERAHKENKYKYTPNTGDLIVTLRDEFIFSCLRDDNESGAMRIPSIIATIARSVLPIRPGRHCSRKSTHSQNRRFPLNCKSRL